jgi:hypothetical protein
METRDKLQQAEHKYSFTKHDSYTKAEPNLILPLYSLLCGYNHKHEHAHGVRQRLRTAAMNRPTVYHQMICEHGEP